MDAQQSSVDSMAMSATLPWQGISSCDTMGSLFSDSTCEESEGGTTGVIVATATTDWTSSMAANTQCTVRKILILTSIVSLRCK